MTRAGPLTLDPWLLAAALLLVGLALFHSVIGERFLVRRLLRRENLPKLFGGDAFTKATIRYGWHLLTLTVLALALVLVWLAAQPPDGRPRALVYVLAATLAVGGLWGIVATRGRHLSWVVLVACAALTLIGGRTP